VQALQGGAEPCAGKGASRIPATGCEVSWTRCPVLVAPQRGISTAPGMRAVANSIFANMVAALLILIGHVPLDWPGSFMPAAQEVGCTVFYATAQAIFDVSRRRPMWFRCKD